MEKLFENKKIKIALIIIFVIIVILRIISAICLNNVFCDEQDILNHMQSIISTGKDNEGQFLPLYSKVGGGLVTFIYLYPMLLFLSIIGVGPIQARIIQQLLTIGACVITAFSLYKLTNKKSLSIITLFTCLISPWGFVQANRIWDPSFVPVYFSLHFLFFSLIESNKNLSKSKTYVYYILCSVFLVLLATVYPPCRIPAVLMYIFCLIKFFKDKKIKIPNIIASALVCFIVSLPLAINLLNPAFNTRTFDLFVFQGNNIFGELWQFICNFLSLISPVFLFFVGDANLRHSTTIFGMLGTLTIIPFIYLIVSFIKKHIKNKRLITNNNAVSQEFSINSDVSEVTNILTDSSNETNSLITDATNNNEISQDKPSKEKSLSSKINTIYLIFIIIATCLSTALTNEGNPHSLRSCLCWLPYAILTSYAWYEFMKSNKTHKIISVILIIISFIITFVTYILQSI